MRTSTLKPDHFETQLMRTTPNNKLRIGIIGVELFLLFGSSMAALVGTMLIWQGTVLDRLWALNQPAHAALGKVGTYVGPLFWALSVILVVTAVGWYRHRAWAFRMTVAIVATQVTGDLLNVVKGDFLRGILGLFIAGALLLYLLRSRIRTAFR
jgi:mannose/fructose/N-acetylgalactosamine-specific phosphotransferase system component IID